VDEWDAPGGGISVLDVDGSSRRQIFRVPEGAFDPVWSPDGGRIAFAVGTYVDVDLGIWTVNVDGSGARALGNGLWDAWGPAWSPDGSRIAFASLPGLGTAAADGTGRVDVDGTIGYSDVDVDWTPDGHLIFSRFLAGSHGPSRIFIAEGGLVRQLIPDATNPVRPDYHDRHPVWLK
jgi:Tol biopolymer transport system component